MDIAIAIDRLPKHGENEHDGDLWFFGTASGISPQFWQVILQKLQQIAIGDESLEIGAKGFRFVGAR